MYSDRNKYCPIFNHIINCSRLIPVTVYACCYFLQAVIFYNVNILHPSFPPIPSHHLDDLISNLDGLSDTLWIGWAVQFLFIVIIMAHFGIGWGDCCSSCCFSSFSSLCCCSSCCCSSCCCYSSFFLFLFFFFFVL